MKFLERLAVTEELAVIAPCQRCIVVVTRVPIGSVSDIT